MADMDTYDADQRTYEEEREYPQRDRSRSPERDRDGDVRVRDEPANGRADRDDRAADKNGGGDDATNPGSNLFVTGIHPRLTEEEVSRLFEKYGEVEKCNIMRDPHSRESRGFGFVKMVTAAEADAAKEALQGEVYEGRTLSIEKARRARPRTPTPGKYFGPPKRGLPLRAFDPYPYYDRPRGGFRGGDRYNDDRGHGRRDDHRRGGDYRDRYDDRGYGRRDDYPPRDRYRDDRYGGDRRGGGYDRPPRGPPPERGVGGPGYGDSAAPRDAPPARSYEERRSYD
ncbi:Serine arginine-rich splicing factor SR45a [Lecanosticta acicola]|uniref:Serine arginine-rich splicing factor SR45a n=1 Tax=Lecanosticta acicola TaxID=111012 RepID=A0AAI8Z3A9_9PEZI|nr:Serine arginine-rich splicing factor SR45a [Lecanosticta acicola]